MRRMLLYLLGVLLIGCNMPGIPLNLEPQTPIPLGTTTEPGAIVCEADSKVCVGSAVHVCSPDGTDFDVRPCRPEETCSQGQCLAVKNTCDLGQPFSLSTTELIYQIRADFKAQTQEIVLNNCGSNYVFLDHVVVRGPVRPDGDPVFTLTEDSQRSVRLDAGQSTTLRVTYRPADGLSQVRGKLDLGLVTDGYTRLSVPLRVSSVCVTVAPQLHLGAIAANAEPPIAWIQNCGTEPVTIDQVQTQRLAFSPLEKLPFRLEPGQHMGTLIELPERGDVRDRMTFEVDQLPDVSTAILGTVIDPVQCSFGVSPSPLMLAVDGDEGSLQVDDSVALFAVQSAAALVPSVPAPETAIFEITQELLGNRARVVEIDGNGVYRPNQVGTTYISYRLVSDTGQRSCDEQTVRVEALPDGDLWVELTWDNIGDRIPTDSGFGRGANLNLHVLANATASDFRSDWDCSVDKGYACAHNTGQVLQTSLAGEKPETIRFMTMDGVYDVGVYLSNPFNFGGAQARVRVYYQGFLIDERTRLLTAPNEFWWVGRITDGGNWTEFDSVFNGFPR